MTFVPTDHLMDIKGQKYLPTQWRVAWLREEHPDAQIETEVVLHDLDRREIMMRATVVLPGSGARATAHCMCNQAEFKFGYAEKAETQAVGRALALLGYGTQFCGLDLDEGERVADAPARPPRATTDGPAISADTRDRAKLRAEVTRLLGQDREALGKLPKPVEQMTLDEMRKTVNWLIVRAQNRSDVSKTEDSTLPPASSERDTTGEIGGAN